MPHRTQELAAVLVCGFGYGAITLYGRLSSPVLLPPRYTVQNCSPGRPALQPLKSNACKLDTLKVWAEPRSLAATEGISF